MDYDHDKIMNNHLELLLKGCTMLELFYPDEKYSSAFEVPYEQLYEEGYRGLIFDIDNTLVPHGFPADEKSVQLFDRLNRIGFQCCLLSNNNRRRVAPFAKALKSWYQCMAMKPLKAGYMKAVHKMGTDVGNTVFIGDQLFTDVWGAKRIGMRSILVDPIDPKEEIQIVLKRLLERVVLCRWEADQKKLEG